MKLVFVNGSPRTYGATGTILHEMADYLSQKDNVEIQYTDLSKLPVSFCRGCMACFKTGECVIKDDGMEQLSKEIQSSDAVIFGSPTYGSNVSGQFKVLIDRGHFVFPQLLYRKHGFSVTTFENANGKKAIGVLNSLIVLSGGILGGNICLQLEPDLKKLSEAPVKLMIRNKAEKFYQMIIKEKNDSILLSLFRFLAFNFFIKPRTLKKKERYAGVLKNWEKAGIRI